MGSVRPPKHGFHFSIPTTSRFLSKEWISWGHEEPILTSSLKKKRWLSFSLRLFFSILCVLSNQDQSHILYIIPSPPSTPQDSLPLAINRLLLCKLWTYLSIFTQSFFLPVSQLLPWTLFPFLYSLASWGKHTYVQPLLAPLPSLGSYTFQAGWAYAFWSFTYHLEPFGLSQVPGCLCWFISGDAQPLNRIPGILMIPMT